MAVAVKLEEERKAGENARLAKAEQHRAIQQQQKQIAQEVHFSPPAISCSDFWFCCYKLSCVFHHRHIMQICE